MNIHNLRVIKNSEINSNLLKAIAMFDRSIFPIDQDYSFPDGYLEKMYEKHKEGLFVLLDSNNVVGYVNCIFLSDEVKEYYLKTKDYLMLKNEGLQLGDNNMYFYTAAIDEKYRDTGVLNILMKQFVSWLNQEKQRGKKISSCISEVVTEDGIKLALAMGMIPENIDENGFGIYYSPDCLNDYIEKIIGKNIDDEER